MPEPWKRRKGESPQAAEASRTYCLMGPNRSLDAVVQELNKSRPLLARWSSRWEWVSRAADFDGWTAAEELKAITERVKQQADRWQKRDEAYRERKFENGQNWVNKSDKMLEFPLATITTDSTEEGGLVIRRTTVKPVRWNMDTVHRLGTRGFQIMREAIKNSDAIDSDEADMRNQNFNVVPYKGEK